MDRNEGNTVFRNIPNSTAKFFPIDYAYFFERPEEKALYAFHRTLEGYDRKRVTTVSTVRTKETFVYQ